MKYFASCLSCAIFLWSPLVSAQMPEGEFIEVKGAAAAVVLAHGRGQGPNSQVVGPLRRAIAEGAQLHTLSLQLPVLATQDYLPYADTFGDAYTRLQAAIDFLTKEKGVKRLYFMGYSMGARMSTAFLARHPSPAVFGYIGVGVLEGGGDILDANVNIRKLRMPVIDIYADNATLDLTSAKNRTPLVGERFKQVQMSGANHSFRGYDAAIAEATIAWLKEQESRH